MSGDVAAAENNAQNGSSCEVQSNGVSNGHHSNNRSSSSGSKHHKSSSKDKHRDKDRDHKSSSSKDHKSSSRDKDRDRHHSSSSSSGKDKHRDKDRENSSTHRNSSSSSHREKDKDRDKDKDKHKSSSSSSSNHHKSSSKDKERKDKDRDRKDGSNSTGSSSKEHRHHKSSSSSSNSRDKDRDRDREKDKDRSSTSSSSKNKHSSSKHMTTSASTNTNTTITSSQTSSSLTKMNDKPNYDGVFIKPEPVIIQNIIDDTIKLYSKTGYESNVICNGNHKIGYEEVSMDVKKEEEETNENLNLPQAISCDYSLTQFKADEPPFVVKQEASYTDDSMLMNNTQDGIDDDEEDMPLAMRKCKPNDNDDEDDDDMPLLARKKIKKENKMSKIKNERKRIKTESDNDEDFAVKAKRKKSKKADDEIKIDTAAANLSPAKRVKKEKNDEEEIWRWWEEEKREDGVKWNALEHKGPVFAPVYERLPNNVRFYYDGKPIELSEETEEAATFYAKMLNHDYCTKDIFNNNFFNDFRKTMIPKEREIIKDFKKCNFQEIHQYFLAESEKRKAATKEEKLARKMENEALLQEYGYCLIDGHKEKIGNFRLEPPGLFRGRGEHPKMGMIKRRIKASDVSINCSKDAKIPEPPKGQRWKDVRHDSTVTWLASWIENVQGQVKYIMLNPSSKLKGEKDHIKYETARRLAKSIDKIRSTYRDEWKSKEMRVRQRAVALYFIDKLALRAGNEKDEDQADTVGCCSLRVEHVQLHKELNGKENVVVFDFLGKDSIRYYNEVEVEKRVFKNLELFMENKKEGDDLFDRLNTQVLNEHLKELMDGLTAKVFRTYNASITLQNQLDLLTDPNMAVPEKLLAYNRANRAVAILCNHQRSVPKGHQKSMENLKEKIRAKRDAIDDCEAEYHDLKKAAKRGSVKEKINADKKAKQLERLKEQLKKLELQETDRDENKTIALGTSKLNYLDPRISVAWCKKHGVPIEKIFNKTQRTKFLWAIHMADENYRF